MGLLGETDKEDASRSQKWECFPAARSGCASWLHTGQEISTDQPLLPESSFHVKKTQENQGGATEHSEQLPVQLIIRPGACHERYQRLSVTHGHNKLCNHV